MLTTGFYPLAQVAGVLPDAQTIEAIGKIGGIGAGLMIAAGAVLVLFKVLAFISGANKRFETLAESCHTHQSDSQDKYQTHLDKITDRFLAQEERHTEAINLASRNMAELTMHVKNTKQAGG